MKCPILIVSLLLVVSLAHSKWELIPGTEEMGIIYTLETDGTRFYADTEHGVYISDDAGDAWRLTGTIHSITAIVVSDNAVHASAGRKHGLYRSYDYGETWNAKNNGLRRIDDRTVEIRLPYIRQILVASSAMLIAVGYHDGTYISRDRGETWRDVSEEWTTHEITIGSHIELVAEFDGYLWAVAWTDIYRSLDDGRTWERVTAGSEGFFMPTASAVFDSRLYIAAKRHYSGRYRSEKGFLARYETAHHWRLLTQGLPPDDYVENILPQYRQYGRKPTQIEALAVNRGRLFAGLLRRGVYVFDERSETWIPAGLDGLTVYELISHQSDLYAAIGEGIYRATIPIMNPYGKAAATWGAVKTE